MNQKFFLAVCLLFSLVSAVPCLGGPEEAIPPLLLQKDLKAVVADIEPVVPRLMDQARIPGLQIALIRDGQIVWHKNYGLRNATAAEPVTDDTIFEAASLTKPFFAYYVMKLVEQGVIDLDKPILSYLPRDVVEKGLGHSLDEKGFHRDWFEKITARHVLSHSSGMPHGESDRPYPLFFEPGTKWKYSAEGYFFLQKAVEHLKGDKLENLMQKEVLNPLGMTRSCLVWRDDYEKTMANGHDLFGKPEGFRKRTESHAAATLYTTAEDYAKFICAVLNGEGLKPKTLKEMLTSQIDMNKEMGLGWSLGFGTQSDANGPAFWQWGDYGIFRNYIIAYPQAKTGVVYLTNSFNGLSVCEDIVAPSLGGRVMGVRDLKYYRYDSLRYRLFWALMESGQQALDRLPALQQETGEPLSLEVVNFLGEIFQEEKETAKLIPLLEYYAKEHPGSGTASYLAGKAHLSLGNKDRAREFLEIAGRATEDKVEPRVLDWSLEYLRAFENPVRLEEAELKKLAGDYDKRHVQLRAGRLFYFRDGGASPDYRPLTAMAKDTFFIEGEPSFRFKFEFDASGNASRIVGIYEDGSRDSMDRTK